jgi:hypothetical protein
LPESEKSPDNDNEIPIVSGDELEAFEDADPAAHPPSARAAARTVAVAAITRARCRIAGWIDSCIVAPNRGPARLLDLV